MLGLIFVTVIFIAVLIAGVFRPAYGMIGFYTFVLLDPAWNWRWAVSYDTPFQKYIFFACVIGFVVNGMRRPTLNKASKWGLTAGITFWLICYVGSMSSILPLQSEFFAFILGKQILCILLTIFLLDSQRKIKTLLVATTLAQAYNAYQINLDYFQTGFSRWALHPWGSYGYDNNVYSLMTVPLLGVSLAFVMCETAPWKKLGMLFVSVLQIHEIMLLQSRGSMLAFFPMVAILLWKMPRTKLNLQIAIMGSACTFLLAGPSVVEEFSSIFVKAEDRDNSAESRFYLWQAGFRITMDYPLTGVGLDAGRVLVPQERYYDGGLTTTNKALHNLFFDVSTGTGIPGLLAYLVFILIPIWCVWKNYEPTQHGFASCELAVLCGSVGYLVASNFSSGLTIESAYVLTTAGYALIIVRSRTLRHAPSADH